MKSQREKPDINGEPAGESDALRLSDIDDREAARFAEDEGDALDPGSDTDLWPAPSITGRQIAIAAGAVVVVAAAVVGGKIAYDRRKSARGYHKAVSALEDARDALLSAASELPERSREVLQRVKNR